VVPKGNCPAETHKNKAPYAGRAQGGKRDSVRANGNKTKKGTRGGFTKAGHELGKKKRAAGGGKTVVGGHRERGWTGGTGLGERRNLMLKRVYTVWKMGN